MNSDKLTKEDSTASFKYKVVLDLVVMGNMFSMTYVKCLLPLSSISGSNIGSPYTHLHKRINLISQCVADNKAFYENTY